MVGQPKPFGEQPSGEAVPAEPFKPLTKTERKQLSLELLDKLLLEAHRNPAGFMADGSSQLNKFLELASRADSEDNTTSLRDMTAKAFSVLSPIEQDRAIVDAIAMLPEEHQQATLERLGMSLADYEELRLASDDLEALQVKQAALADRIAEIVSRQRERV